MGSSEYTTQEGRGNVTDNERILSLLLTWIEGCNRLQSSKYRLEYTLYELKIFKETTTSFPTEIINLIVRDTEGSLVLIKSFSLEDVSVSRSKTLRHMESKSLCEKVLFGYFFYGIFVTRI